MQNVANVAIELIIDHEGGYVNDPNDRGGETKYGISKRAYPDIDIANLTKEQATDIYRNDYWDKIRANEMFQLASPFDVSPKHRLVGAALAAIVVDHGVNAGTSRAIKLIQDVAGMTVDGVVGPNTIRGVQQMIGQHVNTTPDDKTHPVNELTVQRLDYYTSLAQFDRYGTGWVRRVISTHSFAVETMIIT